MPMLCVYTRWGSCVCLWESEPVTGHLALDAESELAPVGAAV